MSEGSIKTIGRYRIEQEIGRGGMAIVYRAHDPHLDRFVAIKFIRRGAFTGDQLETLPERFRREARALAKLDHPNIVKVLDYGDQDGATYLVMEYLEGTTLKEVKKPLRVETAVRLIRPIAEALEYVHDHGILHRDVKPSNIMITKNEKIMLTDFGIAKWLEDETDQYTLTATGIGIGTPEYMAPEQGLGKKIDERADAYALTVVFYELITGRKPFQGETALETLTKQASEPFPDPRTYVPELNESVKKFFDRAMAKKPEDRYPTMKDYLRDLDGLRLQSLAQASSGNTGIQTVKGPAATDSSIRFGKTDMRKVREAAAAAENKPIEISEQPESSRKLRIAWLIPILTAIAVIAGIFALRDWMGKPADESIAAATATADHELVTADAPSDAALAAATSELVWMTETAEPASPTPSIPLLSGETTAIVGEALQNTARAETRIARTAESHLTEDSAVRIDTTETPIPAGAALPLPAAELRKTEISEALSALSQRLTETKMSIRAAGTPIPMPTPTENPNLRTTQDAAATGAAQAATSTAAKLYLEETAAAIYLRETELALVSAEMTATSVAHHRETETVQTAEAIAAAQAVQATIQPTAAALPTPTVYAPYANLTVGDRIEFGRYEQDNNLSNGAEPIE